MSGNVYDELKERDFVAQVSDENALRKMLAGKPITFYVGFDSTASPPHRGRSQTWVRFPSRAERNASHFPSGLKRGLDSDFGLDVTRTGSPPAAGTIQMSVSELSLARSVAVTV